AALGPEFGVESLRRIGEYRPDELIDLLDPAIRAGLLVDLGVPGRFRFSHDLVRQTLYEELTPAERIRLHRRIGQALEEQYASDSGSHLAELAFHYCEAVPGGDAHKATLYAERAGRQAAESLAYEEAARLYRMALRALDAQGTGHEQERCELLLLLGDADTRADDHPAARETFLTAAAIARRMGAGSHLARAALGYGGRFIWARVGRDPHLIPLLQDALVLLGESDARLTVRLLARLACAWRSSVDHREDSAAFTQQALELARGLDDPATLSYALVGRYWATYWPENLHERLQLARELLAVAERAADSERTVDGHWALHVTYSDLAMMAEAKAELEIIRRAATELRLPAHLWGPQTSQTFLALLEGKYERAEALVRAEEQQHDFNPPEDDLSTGRMHRFLLRREQGRLAEEEGALRASVDEFPWYPYFRAALACLLLGLDRVAEARAVFADLARDDFRALYRDCEWLLGVSLASEACVGLGDTASAETLYAQLLPFAGRHAVAHTEGSVGAVDRYLGLLASTLGRLDDAERHFGDAIRLNDRMGAEPWTAHTQADYAQMLVRRDAPDDRRRARELMGAARETAQRLGMAALDASLTEAVGSTGAVSALTRVAPTSGIFRREGEYWTVVFSGSGFRLRDAKGMRYLARLLAEPGRELHVLDLVRLEAMPAAGARPPARGISDGDLKITDLGDAGEILDATARQAYRERLGDLAAEVAEAESWNDPERAVRLRAERSMLVEQLAAAVGLGGRARVAGSASERARLSVAKAIRSSLSRIDAQCPPLGHHLAISLHTGTFCSYSPDPGLSLAWEL
ncbi:MAG TPA: hypothetical protein VN800_06625, partial [Candidatus Acidoferrales bacterium]|nr:hypothetical protein [Candidatus Acidoferrales bacterium]